MVWGLPGQGGREYGTGMTSERDRIIFQTNPRQRKVERLPPFYVPSRGVFSRSNYLPSREEIALLKTLKYTPD